MNNHERWSFQRGEAGSADLNEAIDEFFAVLGEDETIREDARDAEIDLRDIAAAGRDSISISGTSPGTAGIETVIIVTIASKLAGSAWDELILPWLKRRLGPKPLGEKRDATTE